MLAGAVIALSCLRNPELTALLVVTAAVGTAVLLRPGASLRAFLSAVGVLLLGYALFGKGFAYLGVAQLYVGDLVLGFGLVAALVGGIAGAIRRSGFCWLLIAYMAWGALRTIPYLEVHGRDALRDAAVWIYAAYALLVAGSLLRTGWWERIPSIYGRFYPWLLLWLPIGFAVTILGPPAVAGMSVPIVLLKPGDVAVHLAGIASFMLLRPERGDGARSKLVDWSAWVLWMCLFVLIASQNRGGMIAMIAALAVTFMFRRSPRWVPMAFLAVSLAALLTAADLQLSLRGSRHVSTRQVFDNVLSLFALDGRPDLAGSRSWRVEWWTKIVDYTVRGERFWLGKGFGVNLATDDGFQVGDGVSLRSPHNGHLTILARTGVPGFCLWLLVQGGLAAHLARTAVRARRRGDMRWSAFHAWLLATWTAFMMNTGFDVYLEGPQGGIWLWCLVGVGTASMEIERRRAAALKGAQPRTHRIPEACA